MGSLMKVVHLIQCLIMLSLIIIYVHHQSTDPSISECNKNVNQHLNQQSNQHSNQYSNQYPDHHSNVQVQILINMNNPNNLKFHLININAINSHKININNSNNGFKLVHQQILIIKLNYKWFNNKFNKYKISFKCKQLQELFEPKTIRQFVYLENDIILNTANTMDDESDDQSILDYLKDSPRDRMIKYGVNKNDPCEKCWYFCGSKTTISPWSVLISVIVYASIAPIGWQFRTFKRQLADTLIFPSDSDYFYTYNDVINDFSAGFITSWYILIFKKENQTKINVFNYSQYINETGALINDIFQNITNQTLYNNYNLTVEGIGFVGTNSHRLGYGYWIIIMVDMEMIMIMH